MMENVSPTVHSLHSCTGMSSHTPSPKYCECKYLMHLVRSGLHGIHKPIQPSAVYLVLYPFTKMMFYFILKNYK